MRLKKYRWSKQQKYNIFDTADKADEAQTYKSIGTENISRANILGIDKVDIADIVERLKQPFLVLVMAT